MKISTGGILLEGFSVHGFSRNGVGNRGRENEWQISDILSQSYLGIAKMNARKCLRKNEYT